MPLTVFVSCASGGSRRRRSESPCRRRLVHRAPLRDDRGLRIADEAEVDERAASDSRPIVCARQRAALRRQSASSPCSRNRRPRACRPDRLNVVSLHLRHRSRRGFPVRAPTDARIQSLVSAQGIVSQMRRRRAPACARDHIRGLRRQALSRARSDDDDGPFVNQAGLRADRVHCQSPAARAARSSSFPGLGCPGEMWDDTSSSTSAIAIESHVLTLAGFAGTPPIKPPLAAKTRKELIRYIRSRHLEAIRSSSATAWAASSRTGSPRPRPMRSAASSSSTQGPARRRRRRRRACCATLGASRRRRAAASQIRNVFSGMTRNPKHDRAVPRRRSRSPIAQTIGDAIYELVKTDVTPTSRRRSTCRCCSCSPMAACKSLRKKPLTIDHRGRRGAEDRPLRDVRRPGWLRAHALSVHREAVALALQECAADRR